MAAALASSQAFLQARAQDLAAGINLVGQAVQQRKLPSLDVVPVSVLVTTLGASNLLIILLSAKGRRVVLKSLDTLLAVVLLVLLIAIVLGLPIGIAFLFLKAASFLISKLVELDIVQELLANARARVGI